MNNKLVRVLSIVLSVVMLCSFAVVASAKDTKATGLVPVIVEGLSETLEQDTRLLTSEKSLRAFLESLDYVVFAEGSDAIVSVKDELATENSKWQVAVNDVIVTSAFSDFVVDGDDKVVIFNAAEDAVIVSFDKTELESAGILVFNGTDKNGNTAPVAGLKVVWDDKNFTTDKDGKIYLSKDNLEAGAHTVSVSKLNANKVPAVVRITADAIYVEEVEAEEKEEITKFDEIYKFFYDIFQGFVDVFMFFVTAIGGLLGIGG